jgi:hypothetical protein
MPITMAMDTTVKVPVMSGKIPYSGGIKSGAQTVPKTCVVILDNRRTVVGIRAMTMPTVMTIVIEVATTMRLSIDF